ncbi:MAG: hypothetical protein WCP89_02155 [archaeon]
MEWLTRKNGILLCVMGIVIFLLNFLTYSLWGFDIDILGAMVFILGLVLAIACGSSMKKSSKLLSRKNGVLLCIIAVAVTAILGYLPIPVLNGDIGGFSGLVVFVLGLILIVARWKH